MEHIITQASSFAADVDFLIELIFWVAGAWFLAAELVLFYFIFKFRAKKSQKAQYIEGEKHSEAKWIHWPHYAVIAFDVVIIYFAISVWYNVKQTLPDPNETIRVVGQQWAWQFTHPGPDGKLGSSDDLVMVDELHLKVGSTYHFKLESRDVLHSFSIPVFRLKQDAVPGRIITGWFKPTKTGEFDIQCAEMCGIGHGIMNARMFIHTKEGYDAWYNEQRSKQLQSSLQKDPSLQDQLAIEIKREL